MGSSCCHAESPCSSVEERSGLLKDDSKATVPTGRTIVVDTNGPKGDDDLGITPNEAIIKVEAKVEAVQAKKCPEVGETEPNNTQENGPLKDAAPSPRKGSKLKENITRAQDEDMKYCLANSEQAGPLQCTLNSLQREHAAADHTAANTAAADDSPASTPEKVPEMSSTTAEVVCLQHHTETKSTIEQDILASHDNDEEAASKLDSIVAKASGQFFEDGDGILSVPNSRLTAAVCQLSCSSAVSQDIDKVSLSCVAPAEDSENLTSSVCKESAPESLKNQDICESSSSGSEPAGLNHCGEYQDFAYCVGAPETTVLKDAIKSSVTSQEANLEEVTSLENTEQDTGEEKVLKGQVKDGDVLKTPENGELEEDEEEVVKNAPADARSQAGKDAEVKEVTGKEERPAGSSSTGVKAGELSLPEKKASAEDGLGKSEEDLYRGAEELSASNEKPAKPLPTLLEVEDRCSLDPPMDILSYSEREWKGNTAKSALIRKGYKEMSQRFGTLRRVRGDNYCALRATLFQVLTHSTQLPAWLQEEDIMMLPKHLEAQEGLISQWTFPECMQGDGTGDAALQLKGYMELLRNKWQAAVDCSSVAERQQLCERVFRGGEEELGLLEALKLLMLGRAVELHGCMQAGRDVPFFCWLLFARDSSECPRSFFSNHLSHVGLIAGLEQVEMFLLGYTLQCTIQVYRLYKADTEEFVTYYPDDHKDDWPSVCLVTEDDRHYNVPIVEAAEHGERNAS